MAFGPSAACDAQGDRGGERGQQHERRNRSRHRRSIPNEHAGDHQLHEREDERERRCEPGRDAELGHRRTSTRPVGELGHSCGRENHGQDESRRQGGYVHHQAAG
jgi:hypothetical protein